MCITIIGIPFGVPAFKLAGYALWPFGRGLALTGRRLTLSLIGNVLWFIFAGWWLGLVHLFTGIALCLTIIGAALIPLGKEIVALHEGTYALAGMIVFDAGRPVALTAASPAGALQLRRGGVAYASRCPTFLKTAVQRPSLPRPRRPKWRSTRKPRSPTSRFVATTGSSH
jgi:hypothetical protein